MLTVKDLQTAIEIIDVVFEETKNKINNIKVPNAYYCYGESYKRDLKILEQRMNDLSDYKQTLEYKLHEIDPDYLESPF